MFFAASDARKTAVAAISPGSPNWPGSRRAVTFAATPASCSGDRPTVPHSGVPIGPGAMALTRMPCGASSAASVCVIDFSAALLAL